MPDPRPPEKLVRDLIPDIIARTGREPAIRQVSDGEVKPFLHRKVLEEAGELYLALQGNDPGAIASEMADLLEVVRRTANLAGLPWEAIEHEAARRRDARGAFEQNFLLNDPTVMEYRVYGGDRPALLGVLSDHMVRCRRASIAVSFGMRSGVELLGPAIGEALRRKAEIRLLTSDYLDITEPEALEELLALPGALDLRLYHEPGRSFHAKCYIFEHEDGRHAAFVGSSNLSSSALRDGIEWNYLVRETDDGWSIWDLLRRFEALFGSEFTQPVTPEFIAAYRARRQPRPMREEPGFEAVARPQPNAAQREALSELARLRAEGERKALVIAATGVGKTYLAAFDSLGFARVLFLAHREELLAQARASFTRVRPEATTGLYGAGQHDTDAELLFASVATLSRPEHLARFAPDRFDYIVVDEAHHAAARSYHAILQYFKPRFLLGLTATPYRADNRDVFAICDGNVAYRVTFMEAIALGWLCPFQYWGIHDQTNFTDVPWRNGHYDEEALSNAVGTRERADAILKAFNEHASRMAIGFCVSIRHARFMADYFSAHSIPAEAAYAGPGAPDRAAVLERLRTGDLRVVFAVDLFNEGLDVPAIDLVMFLRPTESVTVFLQQLGRGLRLSPDKPFLTVLDFIGNYKRAHYKAPLILGLVEDEPDRTAVARVLREHQAGAVALPPGVAVHFDLKVVELMQEMAAPGEPRRERLVAAYRDVEQVLGRRPRMLELQLQGRYEVKPYRQEFRSWFGFLGAINALSLEERELEQQVGAFLAELERTPMTRSYKMVVLEAFVQLGGLAAPVSVDALVTAFRTFFLTSPRHMRDLAGTPIAELSAVPDKELRAYVIRNPLAAWTNSGADGQRIVFFRLDPSAGTFAYVGPAATDAARFAAAIHERTEFRLADYFRARYERPA